MIAKIIFELVKFSASVLVITTIVDIFLLGLILPHFTGKAKLSKYFVSPKEESVRTISDSWFEFQQGGGCAGFSSAFLLRHLGEQAAGEETFKEVPYQLKGGAGLPKGITGFFKKKGIKMTACTGSFNSLKNELARGNPVIVVIRSFVGKNDLHFATVTGYDEENLYLVDSIKSWVNVDKDGNPIQPSEDTVPTCNESVYYNRVVPVKDFKKLWNTSMLKMPLYRNMFFVMK
ncbi:MAG: C39 family peptidase [Treponema sp.]|nr:C39 family peptidase [Treponema sp.]